MDPRGCAPRLPPCGGGVLLLYDGPLNFGGDEGVRTLDLLDAIQTLSQLSYVPIRIATRTFLRMTRLYRARTQLRPFLGPQCGHLIPPGQAHLLCSCRIVYSSKVWWAVPGSNRPLRLFRAAQRPRLLTARHLDQVKSGIKSSNVPLTFNPLVETIALLPALLAPVKPALFADLSLVVKVHMPTSILLH